MVPISVEERGYLNISEAAALLGVSRVTIWRWIRAGRLPVVRMGHRTTRIELQDLEQFRIPRAADGSASNGVQWANSRIATAEFNADEIDWSSIGPGEHLVQFYENDGFLLDSVAAYNGAALRAGDVAIAVVTPEHRVGLQQRLEAEGHDIAALSTAGQYMTLDAAETLARFMVDDVPDRERFIALLGDVITQAATVGRGVRVYGEMVALLAADGNHPAALSLEALWNELQQSQPFSLFCSYSMDRLGGAALADLLNDVCAAHSRVIPAESYAALATNDDRQRAIAELQRKASWLEVEIAERKRAEEQLRAALEAEHVARQQAEAALRVRDEFLSIAAHELKTPLTGLAGHAQFLLRQINRTGEVDARRVEQALHVITGQADKLSRLISQLLDISRLEAGKLTLEPRLIDLGELVTQVVTTTNVASNRHAMNVVVPAGVEAYVDPMRIEQVLTNLLDNAMKFSPSSKPIDVSLSQPIDGMIELTVRDYGPGIPDDRREQVFERFYQVTYSGQTHGLGLGLHISRQIIDLHGGRIYAETPADGGTRIVVRLPCVAAVPAVAD